MKREKEKEEREIDTIIVAVRGKQQEENSSMKGMISDRNVLKDFSLSLF